MGKVLFYKRPRGHKQTLETLWKLSTRLHHYKVYCAKDFAVISKLVLLLIVDRFYISLASYFFRYSYSVSSTVLDIDSVCKKNSDDQEPFYSNWYNDFSDEIKAQPPVFMRRYQQVRHNADIGKDVICKNNMKTGIAVVKFQLATQTVTQIEKKLRYSSADYISNLGKIYLNRFEREIIYLIIWLLKTLI